VKRLCIFTTSWRYTDFIIIIIIIIIIGLRMLNSQQLRGELMIRYDTIRYFTDNLDFIVAIVYAYFHEKQ